MQHLAVALVLVTFPAVARAQSAVSGSIAGVVKDSSGAVMPGVTVEAASPALIEKVRTAVTDDQGNYKIVDLRPGVYSVTFTLPGFGTVVREGLELTTGFTANANAELKVGALEETLTVSGVTPVVDVQNVRQQTVLTQKVLDQVPTGKALQGFATMLVGAALPASAQDVGGNRGDLVTSFGVHGSRPNDLKLLNDGMSFNTAQGDAGGGGQYYKPNLTSAQEIVLQTGANSAESETGGVQLNIVPKEGGNSFKVYGLANYSGPKLQSENFTDELLARGLATSAPVKYVYDVGLGIGGPIKRNKLWFYSGNRWWGAAQTIVGNAGGFYNATHDTLFYTPDPTRPAYRAQDSRDNNVRLTWQAAATHKINGSFYDQYTCACFAIIEGHSPEASRKAEYKPNRLGQITWSNPATNKLLFDGGISVSDNTNTAGRQPVVTEDTIGVVELSTALNYRAAAEGYGPFYSKLTTERFSAQYVTGSHALKAGFIMWQGDSNIENHVNQDIIYTFRNALPQSITQYATPTSDHNKVRNLGIFAQDQWTINRLTVNAGVRFDYVNSNVVATHQEAGRFVPARDFPEVKNVPNWKDVSPRLGGAYDLFGDGRTVVKASLGRYLAGLGASVASANNPVNSTVASATRTWTDNGDFIPQESELGPLSNANFGRSVITTRWSPDLLDGYDRRGYNWQGSLSVQRELRPGVAVTAGYFRTWYGNFRLTDNLAVGPGDYDPYCITSPVDARLPGGGGQQICGLYDITPTKFGVVDNLVTQAELYGKQTEVYNGVDLTMSARFGKGAMLAGGLNTGKTVTDNCDVLIDSPQRRFCRVTLPYAGQTQVKFSGIYPLPWEMQVSATYQNLPGIPVTASYVATNAQTLPTLGRNLGQCRGAATCNGTVTVELIEPNTQFEDRINQFDIRLTRSFRVGRTELRGSFDAYNVFNASSILAMTTRYGTSWLQPSNVLGGRLLKFGVQIDY